jgi:hypothetical protein
MRTNHRLTTALKLMLISVAIGTTGCKEAMIPDYNNPSVNQLLDSPTASVVNLAVQGMLIGLRAEVSDWAVTMGQQGREVYNLDPANPSNFISNMIGPLTPAGFAIDLNWSNTYRNLRGAVTILDAVEKVTDYTTPQKEGIRGFVKTLMALDMQSQLRARDTLGIVVDINPDPNGPLGPLVSKDAALTRISELLDEAAAHLQSAGATPFVFQLTTGFAGFNTPAPFLRANRAIKARNEVYRRQWAAALTALQTSFISMTPATAANLQVGLYHVYSTSSGDVVNPLFDATPTRLVAHPSYLTDAQRRADGSPDLRASAKAVANPARTVILQNVSSNVRITRYATNTDAVPIMKNEELILLRAEANWNAGNRQAAIDDINLIRTVSGGLTPATLTVSSTADEFVDELLYNRRYSLFYEYGHRWVDMRRYGRLAQLPRALPTHRIFRWFPLPVDECSQRGDVQPACATENGL